MTQSTKTRKQKTEKKCFIVARYFIKRTGSVCCKVRNEAGKEYTTCLHANGSTSCDCPATKECYHIRHVVATEAARTPVVTPTAYDVVEEAVKVVAQVVEKHYALCGHRCKAEHTDTYCGSCLDRMAYGY